MPVVARRWDARDAEPGFSSFAIPPRLPAAMSVCAARSLKNARKIVESIACYSPQFSDCAVVRLDSLSVSRSGKSSGELSSVMIRNPMVGNSLEARVDLQDITKHE